MSLTHSSLTNIILNYPHLLVDVGRLEAHEAAVVDGAHVAAEPLGLVQDLSEGDRVSNMSFLSPRSKLLLPTFVLSIGRRTVTRVSRTSKASEEIL